MTSSWDMPVGYRGISQKHRQVQQPSSFWRATYNRLCCSSLVPSPKLIKEELSTSLSASWSLLKKSYHGEKLFESDSILLSPSNLRVVMVLFFHFKRWTNKLVKSALTHASRFNSTTETTDCANHYQHKQSATQIGTYSIPKQHLSPQKLPQVLHHTLVLLPSFGIAVSGVLQLSHTGTANSEGECLHWNLSC